jgi:large subunit ribosomal protein L5
MYNFFHKLVSIVLPQVKDFQGVSLAGFDNNGNYNLGLTEQIIFPEINYDKISQVNGLGINIITTANNNTQAKLLLKALGMPFAKKEKE